MSELEADRLDGAPHPRETRRFVGHAVAERTVLEALATGRLHHAWLLGGPEGVGKATFAYRLARRVLAGIRPGARLPSLDVPEEDAAARRILAGSHPDLIVLRRTLKKDGKGLTSNIPVDLVRRALGVFGATAAAGGWRVCIIDSAEDLDRAAANALLKLIEEPPANSLFLIVAHQPQRVLPTIRSRCRKLEFCPLAAGEVAEAMAATSLSVASDPALERAASLAGGSVRQGLLRLDPEAQALIDAVRVRLEALPQLDMAALLALAEDVGGRGRDEDFALALDTVEAWLGETLRRQAGAGGRRLLPLVAAWEQGRRAAREAETYNLDRRPLILGIFQELAAALRGGA